MSDRRDMRIHRDTIDMLMRLTGCKDPQKIVDVALEHYIKIMEEDAKGNVLMILPPDSLIIHTSGLAVRPKDIMAAEQLHR